VDSYQSALRNSIDILPGGLREWQDTPLPEESPKVHAEFPFILVEGNLGIPKKVLYAIYLSAVSTSWRASEPHMADAISSIIILANPAHQTALNTRKRLIIGGHLDPQKELALCELMARGSPEFGKQSMVWAHRRWCFTQIYGTMEPSTRTLSPLPGWASSEETRLFPRLSPASAQHELRLIQHTCETYPRNYHAWAHWHHVIDVCYASFVLDKAPWGGIIAQECARLRGWIDLHVSDYSAMHQLLQVQSILEQVSREEGNSPVEHALSLVKAFPSHESLWMYFRGMLRRVPTVERAEIVRSTAKEQSMASKSHEIIQLEEWFRRCA
jgi:protein prenyltransferase alpha subunit repeat containing protein 1